MNLLAVLIAFLALADAPVSTPPTTGQGSEPEAAAAKPNPAAGNPLLASAASTLERATTISARVRQSTSMHERQLVGVGTYTQQAAQPEVLSRLALKTQVDKHTASLQQVVDGRFLWERRDLPGKVTLTRIDLRKVREALSTAVAEGRPSFGPPLAWGGLPRMLRELDAHFAFAAPVQAQLGAVPVFRLEGRWKPEVLSALVASQKAAIAKEGPQLEKLPDHVPGAVVLFLGSQDQFPHRLEYHRVLERAGEGEPETTPTLTLEFYDVRFNTQLDPLEFTYKPDSQIVRDETNNLLHRLGLKPRDQTARKVERDSSPVRQ